MNSKIFSWILKSVLVLLICVLAIATTRSIMRPQKFKTIYENRLEIVKQRLIAIRTIQNVYKNEHKTYATSIDSLVDFVNNGTVTIQRSQGFVPENMTEEEALKQGLIKREEVKVSVKSKVLDQDSTVNLDNFQYIPYTNKEKFNIESGVIKGKNFDVPTYRIIVTKDVLFENMDNDIQTNTTNVFKKLWNQLLYSGLSEETIEKNKYKDVIMGSLTEAHTNGNWE